MSLLFVVAAAGAVLADSHPWRVLNVPETWDWDHEIDRWAFAADGERVVYLANEASERYDIFSVRVDGRERVQITNSDGGGPGGGLFQLAASERRIVWGGSGALYSAAVEGGDLVELNIPFGDGGGLGSRFWVTADGDRVIYAASADGTSSAVYSVPAAGGESVELLSVGYGDLVGWDVLPGSDDVVIHADRDGDSDTELYVVHDEGGSAVLVSSNVPASSTIIGPVKWSPDGRWIVFFVEDAHGSLSLWSAPSDGRGAVMLTEAAPGMFPEISDDSSTVTYTADHPEDGEAIYAVPIEGGEVVTLSEDLPYVGSQHLWYGVAGGHAFYLVGDGEIRRVPLAGGPYTTLVERPEGDEPWESLSVTPDGRWVQYRTGSVGGGWYQYVVPVEGGEPWQLRQSPVSWMGMSGDHRFFLLSQQGQPILVPTDGSQHLVLEFVPPEGMSHLGGPFANHDSSWFVAQARGWHPNGCCREWEFILAAPMSAARAVSDEPENLVRTLEHACPDGSVPEDGFRDVAPEDVHEFAIDCTVWWQVAHGVTPDRFEPLASVTRGQMASFMARALERSGYGLPSAPEDYFPDDDGTSHELQINQLTELGVLTGYSDGTFEPRSTVTRAQMATFVVKTHHERTSGTLASQRDHFIDDNGSRHEANINAAAQAGLVAGRSIHTYDPDADVERRAMASFVARLLDLFVAEGYAGTPAA